MALRSGFSDFRKTVHAEEFSWKLFANRSGGIRTHDPHYPKVVRYQAALRPECRRLEC